jgi:hypothetical protein
MPSKPLRKDLIDSFLLSMATRDIFSPPEDLEAYTLNLQKDLEIVALNPGLRGLVRLVGSNTRHDS